MPVFTVPIHEFNTCHEPAGSPAGGQFCSEGVEQAQLIRPGQAFDLVAAVKAGDPAGGRMRRRFLFNPETREVALGVAMGVAGREESHAEAFDKAAGVTFKSSMGATAAGRQAWFAHQRRYDTFTVHGHLQFDADDNEMAIVVDRISPLPEKGPPDQLAEMASRFSTIGATKTTPILARPFPWTTFGKAFPDVFPRARVRRTRRKAA